MDLLDCQKTRKITSFYHQLKAKASKLDRLEFITELNTVLRLEPHSIVLEEVCFLISLYENIQMFYYMFILLLQLIELLAREHKMLIADIDKETMNSLRNRQNELFRNYIASSKIFKPNKKE